MSSFDGHLTLPTPPTITQRRTVSNATELAAALGINGVEVTFSGSGFTGALALGAARDQRWIFPAGFTLTAPQGNYAIQLGTSQRIELIGTGGRVVGAVTSSSYSDLTLRGMDVSTTEGTQAIYLESNSFENGTRVLIESSRLRAYSYALIFYGCSGAFIIANTELSTHGGPNSAATLRAGDGDTVLVMDSRVRGDGMGQLLRAHEGQRRYAVWNVQAEGSTGVYIGPTGSNILQAEDVVLIDNAFYVAGQAIAANHVVSVTNITMATIFGNRGYTNYETGAQLATGNTGPGWLIGSNPRSPATTPPVWQRQ